MSRPHLRRNETAEAFLQADGDGVVWEWFHENSKTSRVQPHPYFGHHPTDHQVVTVMQALREVKVHPDRERVPLPTQVPPLTLTLDEALLGRRSARAFAPGPVTLAQVATVLQCSYGVTRDAAGTAYPRSFRAIPSGGALYPLEIYVWVKAVDGLAPGLYHYDPHAHELDVLGPPDHDALVGAFVQADLAESSAVTLLLDAVFFRSVFKYGDRGYRFVLVEAGHLAQNAVLAALGCGLAAVPIGGYLDRELDDALGFDGLNESVVYAVHLGRQGPS